MVLEDMIHFGELPTAFWQMGLVAPYKDFGDARLRDFWN
jgi:hypothetical protein